MIYREKHERSKRLKKYLEQYGRWKDCEKDRGRVVYRDMQTCTDASFLNCLNDGTVDYIKTVGCISALFLMPEAINVRIKGLAGAERTQGFLLSGGCDGKSSS